MKTTTKFFAIAAIAVAILFGNKAQAQSYTPASKWRLGIGVEGGLTSGTLNTYSNALLGGTVRLQYGLSNHVALMLTTGYYSAFGKTIPYTDEAYKYRSQGFVPAKVGAKLYIGKRVYLSGETGAAFEMQENYQNQVKQTKLVLSGGLGYSLKNVDFGLRYESLSGDNNIYGFTALRIAYGFGL